MDKNRPNQARNRPRAISISISVRQNYEVRAQAGMNFKQPLYLLQYWLHCKLSVSYPASHKAGSYRHDTLELSELNKA